MGLANIELQGQVINTGGVQLKAVAFFDAGLLAQNLAFLTRGNLAQWRADGQGVQQSMGVGIRFNTPIGPLRFDYGLGLQRASLDQWRGAFWDNLAKCWEPHFSIGQTF